MSIDIVLNRSDRIYKPDEMVSGVVVVQSKGGLSHNGITLQMTGKVSLQLNTKSVGLFDAMYNSVRPITLVHSSVVQEPGKVPDGIVEIPFEFKLESTEGYNLLDTYRGVYISVDYVISVELKRPLLGKDLSKQLEFIVEVKSPKKLEDHPFSFKLTQDNVIDPKKKNTSNIPMFNISGTIDSINCNIKKPLSGNFIIHDCAHLIKSIELQLLRVEACGGPEGYVREVTEIQNIQICDGNVARNFEIPIYMIFPRLFTCSTVSTKTYKIDFEVDVVVYFGGGTHVSKKIPINLFRV